MASLVLMDSPTLPLGAYWVIPGKLAGGPRPNGRLDGFDIVVDLTEDGAPETATRRFHRPIPDFQAPPPALVTEVLDGIDRGLGTGAAVYVHCGAGLGRTGTIVGCWLARHGTTGYDAIERIAALRAAAGLQAIRSPETKAQRDLVIDWPTAS